MIQLGTKRASKTKRGQPVNRSILPLSKSLNHCSPVHLLMLGAGPIHALRVADPVLILLFPRVVLALIALTPTVLSIPSATPRPVLPTSFRPSHSRARQMNALLPRGLPRRLRQPAGYIVDAQNISVEKPSTRVAPMTSVDPDTRRMGWRSELRKSVVGPPPQVTGSRPAAMQAVCAAFLHYGAGR